MYYFSEYNSLCLQDTKGKPLQCRRYCFFSPSFFFAVFMENMRNTDVSFKLRACQVFLTASRVLILMA